MSEPVIRGAFTATGNSENFRRDPGRGAFNMSLWGTFVGTVIPERSFDGGDTFLPLTALGSSISFTAPCTEIFEEPEAGVLYRLRCSAYTSGTINYRLSQ